MGTEVIRWWVLATVITAALLGIFGRVATGHLFGIVLDRRFRYSLARLQMVIWTVVVVSLGAALVVESARVGTAGSGISFSVPTNFLILLGISFASTLITVATEPPQGVWIVPRLRQLWTRDDDPDAIVDVFKLQLVLVLLLVLITYLVGSVAGLVAARDQDVLDALPNISLTMVILWGLSNVAYLAGALVVHAVTPPSQELIHLQSGGVIGPVTRGGRIGDLSDLAPSAPAGDPAVPPTVDTTANDSAGTAEHDTTKASGRKRRQRGSQAAQRRTARSKAAGAVVAGGGFIALISTSALGLTQAQAIEHLLTSIYQPLAQDPWLVAPLAALVALVILAGVRQWLQRRQAIVLMRPVVAADVLRRACIKGGPYDRLIARSTVLRVLAYLYGSAEAKPTALAQFERWLIGGLDSGSLEQIGDAIITTAIDRNWISPEARANFDEFYRPTEWTPQLATAQPEKIQANSPQVGAIRA